VPFRLLGFATDPDKASILCGQTFARYAADGTEVTLVCAAARESGGADHPAAATRQLGVGNLVLLDYRLDELTWAALHAVFADVMRSVQPQVVVVDGCHPVLTEATTSAFSTVRRVAGGSGALPAKLYVRPAAEASVRVTTAIAIPTAAKPELFIRVFPDPWVTGVLERDLFAGLSADPGTASTLAERLAS
jgi:LmbE family N-acetylglucosaminyl deacetylase